MSWHVVYTKPLEEFRAQENLINQGFETFLPTLKVEKHIKNQLKVKVTPLFSRYLFINFDSLITNWGVIRSTRGVNQLLRFGKEAQPVIVSDEIVEGLRALANHLPIKEKFTMNEELRIVHGPFKGLNGFYQRLVQTPNGDLRAMLLVEFLGKQQRMQLPIHQLRVA